MRFLFLLLTIFASSAHAQVNRFWDNPSAYPTDLNRAWIETQGNCSASNQSQLSIIKSRSSSLSLEENGLPLSEMLDMILTTPHFPNINSLDLRKANFSKNDLTKLNQLVPRMVNVTDLYLGGSSIPDKRMLINYILTNLANQIQILDLSDMRFDASDARMLGGVIGSMKNLRVLYLGGNDLGDDGFGSLMNYGIANLKNLQILSLQKNNLTDVSVKRFAMSVMPRMTSLQILDLKWNMIGSDATRQLVTTSMFLPQIIVLDLDSTLGKSAKKHVSEFLKCSTYSSGVFADPVQ
ncbi:MAG: hypothetical protein FJX34_04205 [Alphaproteobacteria bacterium]|nr:hypothetical protein [Alphaproteobacteria bacterium]